MHTLIDFGVQFMTKKQVPRDHALYISQTIVQTEAFRQSTHGLDQYQWINAHLNKHIDPQAEPTIIHRQGAIAQIDGCRCLGALAMKLAKELATEYARQHGIALVTCRNAEWLGALGTYLVSIAQEGFIAQATAQLTGAIDCAPFGGIDPCFSTNPIAMAFPAPDNPVLADFSCATMSWIAATTMARLGKKTPVNRFIDSCGNPTNDPDVVNHGGTIMFTGGDFDGYKFYAFSIFNEVLALLAGATPDAPKARSMQSFSLMVLDPAIFVGTENFLKEIKYLVANIKTSHPRPGFEVRLPGERGFEALKDCQINGIPLDEEKIQILREIAQENNIEPVTLGD